MSSFASADPKVKQPNVSGQFYDANSNRLSTDIENFFKEADVGLVTRPVDIVVAPHAGYMYSGGVAAYGFKALSQESYKTIVILAPSHYAGFDGVSIWEEGGFQTPLGIAAVDDTFAKKLIAANDKFYFSPKAFDNEHSLEVEIPFLQKTFKDFKIVPVIMGQPSFDLLDDFANALNDIIGTRKDVLVVVSTDMSHYHDDTFARDMDLRTIEAVKGIKVEQVWKECKARTMEMCGCVPMTAAMLFARKRGLDEVDVLRYGNSGDVTGDKDSVVGYASLVFYGKGDRRDDASKEPNISSAETQLTIDQKRALINIARNSIDQYVRTGKKLEVSTTDKRLSYKEGAFVTIHEKGQLRGCIGNIISDQPLYVTVRDMAIASAVEDPRFPKVALAELDDIDVEISVLSKPRVIKNIDEIELGVHGVIVSKAPFHHGVFLPQVAKETNWTKEEFLSQLCSQKARLSPDAWKDPQVQLEIFTADVFSEEDVR